MHFHFPYGTGTSCSRILKQGVRWFFYSVFCENKLENNSFFCERIVCIEYEITLFLCFAVHNGGRGLVFILSFNIFYTHITESSIEVFVMERDEAMLAVLNRYDRRIDSHIMIRLDSGSFNTRVSRAAAFGFYCVCRCAHYSSMAEETIRQSRLGEEGMEEENLSIAFKKVYEKHYKICRGQRVG